MLDNIAYGLQEHTCASRLPRVLFIPTLHSRIGLQVLEVYATHTQPDGDLSPICSRFITRQSWAVASVIVQSNLGGAL